MADINDPVGLEDLLTRISDGFNEPLRLIQTQSEPLSMRVENPDGTMRQVLILRNVDGGLSFVDESNVRQVDGKLAFIDENDPQQVTTFPIDEGFTLFAKDPRFWPENVPKPVMAADSAGEPYALSFNVVYPDGARVPHILISNMDDPMTFRAVEKTEFTSIYTAEVAPVITSLNTDEPLFNRGEGQAQDFKAQLTEEHWRTSEYISPLFDVDIAAFADNPLIGFAAQDPGLTNPPPLTRVRAPNLQAAFVGAAGTPIVYTAEVAPLAAAAEHQYVPPPAAEAPLAEVREPSEPREQTDREKMFAVLTGNGNAAQTLKALRDFAEEHLDEDGNSTLDPAVAEDLEKHIAEYQNLVGALEGEPKPTTPSAPSFPMGLHR